MSYILDAIKKAEAERNLGAVPSIHAHPAFHPSGDDRVPFWKGPLMWIALTAFLAVLLAFMWLRLEQRAPVTVIMPPPQVKLTPVPTTHVDVPVVAQPEIADPAPALAEVPVDMVSAPDRPLKHVSPARPTRDRTVEPALARPPVSLVAQSAPAPIAPESTKAAPSLPPAGAAVPALNELPDHIQREVPPLITGGYIYTHNPATRSVLINGKLLHEGDQVAPDLTLEKLTPNGAILNFKGYRYRSGY
jgi:general secretion pathway protein B